MIVALLIWKPIACQRNFLSSSQLMKWKYCQQSQFIMRTQVKCQNADILWGSHHCAMYRTCPRTGHARLIALAWLTEHDHRHHGITCLCQASDFLSRPYHVAFRLICQHKPLSPLSQSPSSIGLKTELKKGPIFSISGRHPFKPSSLASIHS